MAQKYGGDYINNNDYTVIRCRIENNLYTAFKKLLDSNKTTQQDAIEKLIKEYIISNIKELFEDKKGTK